MILYTLLSKPKININSKKLLNIKQIMKKKIYALLYVCMYFNKCSNINQIIQFEKNNYASSFIIIIF